MVNYCHTIFQYGVTPLVLKGSYVDRDGSNHSITLWKNPAPNSPLGLRPLYLIREEESSDELLSLVVPETDAARQELVSDGVFIRSSGVRYECSIKIMDSMKDLKFKRMVSGLGGADCLLCVSRQKDWTQPEQYQQGFAITRSATTTRQLYNDLVTDDGNIERSNNDFETRKGLTRCPITTSSQHSIAVTHSYINGTSWFVKLIARCRINYTRWSHLSNRRGEALTRSNQVVIDTIQRRTGLVLEQLTKHGGKSGNETTGNQGRKFFSEIMIPVIKELTSNATNHSFQECLLKLHSEMSSILRVIASTEKVNEEAFRNRCNECVHHLHTNLPWVLLNHTLHGALQHSSELIGRNDGYGLGAFSEEGLEANNKDIREFLKTKSRKCDPFDQLSDVMHRLLERSDPIVTKELRNLRVFQVKKKSLVFPLNHYDSLVYDLLQ